MKEVHDGRYSWGIRLVCAAQAGAAPFDCSYGGDDDDWLGTERMRTDRDAGPVGMARHASADSVEGAARAWAVLRTQSHQERVAVRAVLAQEIEPYLPLLPPRRPSEAELPLFPGYLFASVDARSDDLLRIRSAPGVAYVLPPSGPPALISEAIMGELRSRLSAQADQARARKLQRGDRVSIVAGPLRWHDAIFDRHLKATGRVRILLEVIERTMAVDIEESMLKRTG
jgi:transcriptional antiterminator RfaH